MTEDPKSAKTSEREAVIAALEGHAESYPIDYRPGRVAYDAECPWCYGEIDWDRFADAVLDALREVGRVP